MSKKVALSFEFLCYLKVLEVVVKDVVHALDLSPTCVVGDHGA